MLRNLKAGLLVVALIGLNAPRLHAIIWYWSNPLPHGNDIFDLAYTNGFTVEVTDSGQMYTSDDLNLWLPQNTYTTNSLLAVTYFGNRLVAVGADGTVVYSDDGVNFTYTNLTTPNGDWFLSVAASSNLLVAIGDEAIIYTSKDGAGWTRQTGAVNPNGAWLRGVSYGNGLFVAVGELGYIETSPNGTTWTKQSAPLAFRDDLNWVKWINTPASSNGFATPSFIAVSDQGNSITSANGTTWSNFYNPIGTNSLYAATGDNDSRLITGLSQLYLQTNSSLATNSFENEIALFSFETNKAPAWTYFSTIAETNTYLVSGEAGFSILGNAGTNGNYDWVSLDNSSRSWMWQVMAATNVGLYVAVGNQARIMTSDNGANWSVEAVPSTNGVSATNTVFFGVGGSTNLLIAVGNAGTVALSTNVLVTVVTTNLDGTLHTNQVSTMGIIWNPMPPPTTNDLDGIIYFGSQYFIGGGNGTIMKSPDGQNWTLLPTPTTHYISSFADFGGGLVAAGDAGTILTSPDGNTWTQRTSGTTNWIFRVRYTGGQLIGVGENGTILTSTDGINWTSQASGVTAWLNDVCQISNTFYLVGNQGTVLTSTNATTWTPVSSVTYNSLYGVATQNGQLVTVGLNGAILRSQVIPFTSPVEIQTYAQADGQNIFFVSGTTNQGVIAIDQQFTLDSSPDLANWTTGPLLTTDTSGTLLFYVAMPTNSPPNQYYRTHLVLPP
jgi:photosystem II stability/assembly factor-like uncharacterized protein